MWQEATNAEDDRSLQGQLCTPLDLADKKEHEIVADYLRRRYEAKTESELPEEERTNWKARLEERTNRSKLLLWIQKFCFRTVRLYSFY